MTYKCLGILSANNVMSQPRNQSSRAGRLTIGKSAAFVSSLEMGNRTAGCRSPKLR